MNSRSGFSISLLHPRFWLTWFLLGIFYLLTLLPTAALDNIGGKLGNVLAKINRKRFNVVLTNLRLCFPDLPAEQTKTMAKRHFQFLMRGLVHYGLIWWASDDRLKKHLQFEGFDLIEKARADGKNVLILLSHCTGLDFAVAAISMQYASAGPYKPFDNAVVDYMISCGRQRFDCEPFTRDEGFRPLLRLAGEGKVIIYLADEDLGPEVSVFAPFFGVTKATIPLLGKLAKSCNAEVLPCFSCYDLQQQKYRVKLFEPMLGFPTSDQDMDTLLMNQMIEQTLEDCPEQYFWTLKLFKTRPEGEASVY
ncbi:MAG: lysophospholipid acyltransferase family protein [Chromatiales bacterium]